MATHKIRYTWICTFDDGTEKEIPFHESYYFWEQKGKYLISWLEEMIEEENIVAKPLFITEKMVVEECEPYKIIIGL